MEDALVLARTSKSVTVVHRPGFLSGVTGSWRIVCGSTPRFASGGTPLWNGQG